MVSEQGGKLGGARRKRAGGAEWVLAALVALAGCGGSGDSAAAVQAVAAPGPAACAAGEVACGEVCADLSVDAHNCGLCGVTCARGQWCHAARCIETPRDVPGDHEATRPAQPGWCALGTADCGGGCQDVTADDANCGRCGHGCAAGTHCAAARCQ